MQLTPLTFPLPVNTRASYGGVYTLLSKAGKNPANGLSCYSCDTLFSLVVQPNVDHLIPVSHRPGGRRLRTNNTGALALLCKLCNQAKAAIPFLDYARSNPQVAYGLRKQSSILIKDPKLVNIAKEQLLFADKANKASRWTIHA